MEEKDEGKIAQIREEHGRRVLERYEDKSKNFRHLLTGVTGFALAFFILILLPYFSIHRQNEKIAKRLQTLPLEIEEKQKRIEACENLAEGVQELREAIASGPQKLRRFIQTLQNHDMQPAPSLQERSSPPVPNAPLDLEPVQQMQAVQQRVQQPMAPVLDSCAHLPESERVKCRVREAVLIQFADFENIMRQKILGPLQEPEVAATVMLDTLAIRHGLDSLGAEFNRQFEANAEFWRTYQGKGSFFVELDDEVSRFWSKYGATLQSQSDTLRRELERLEKSKEEFAQQVVQLTETEKEVATRLSQIESPLGKLPVGLNESILIFPLVLAIGFWLCASSFYETAKLRRAFHDFYLQKDPQQIILTDQQIALIAPLWIDPINTEQNWKLKLAVLLLPSFFFAVACGLIIYLWTLPSALSSPIQPWVYGGLYGLSLGLFGYGYWQVKEALQQYKKKIAIG